MKIFLKQMLMGLFLLIGMGMVTSCSNDDDDNGKASEPIADYAVLFYGTAGGNLDPYLLFNLQQVEGFGYSDNVRFTAQIKASNPLTTNPNYLPDGTQQYDMLENGKLEHKKIADENYRMDDPKNLANFIKEAKKRLPAKHYILVLWNHGTEFNIFDQPVDDNYNKIATRDALLDDNTHSSLSIFELEEALKLTGEKLDMIYFDMCLMNSIENLYQIHEYTNYVLGSAHPTPGFGGNYTYLLNSLNNNPELKDAMNMYVPEMVNFWKETQSASAVDLTFTDMSYMDEAVECVKNFTTCFKDFHDNIKPDSKEELEYQYIIGTIQPNYVYYNEGGIFYYFEETCKSVDLCNAFMRLGAITLNGKLSSYATRLKIVLDKMIVKSCSYKLPVTINQVSLAILFTSDEDFTKVYDGVGYEVTAFDELYSKLKFDQATGWGDFLRTNKMNLFIQQKFMGMNENGEPIFEFVDTSK